MFFLEADGLWHAEIGCRIVGAQPFQDRLQPGIAGIGAVLSPAPADDQGLDEIPVFGADVQES